MPELMDDPALDPAQHVQALRGLSRINRWSRSARLIWSALHAVARESGVRHLRVLDVATGAGDIPLRLWRYTQHGAIQLTIEGCDVSPTAIQYAQTQACQHGAAVKFFVLDALTTPIPVHYDVVMSSLFTHHLTDSETIRLLQRMKDAATRMVLVNDLRRSRLGLLLAYAGTHLLSRSTIVHIDGPRSVQAAYTIDEIRRLAEQAGLTRCPVQRRWPARWLLTWQPTR